MFLNIYKTFYIWIIAKKNMVNNMKKLLLFNLIFGIIVISMISQHPASMGGIVTDNSMITVQSIQNNNVIISKKLSFSSDTDIDNYFAGNNSDGLSPATAYILSNIIFDLNNDSQGAIYIKDTTRYINITYNIFQNGKEIITASDFYYAIEVDSANNIVIGNNNLNINSTNIYVTNSDNIIIKDNIFHDNSYGDLKIKSSTNIVIRNNRIINSYNYPINIDNGETIIIDNNTIENAESEIYVNYALKVSIINNRYSGIYSGISANYAHNIRIADNELYINENGIYVQHSDNTTIVNNIIKPYNQSMENGIYMSYSNNSTINNNVIEKATNNGIRLFALSTNHNTNITVSKNYIMDSFIGIGIKYTENSKFYLNSLFTNSTNDLALRETNIENQWFIKYDNGSCYGNYWSDFRSKYPSAKVNTTNTKIWDTAYLIAYGYSGGDMLHYDFYPLVNPVRDMLPQISTNFANKTVFQMSNSTINLNWAIHDFASYNATYSIKINGTEIRNGNWTDTQIIDYSLNISEENTYIFEFSAIEIISNETIQLKSIVFVTDMTEPHINVTGPDKIHFGDIGYRLNWTITDTIYKSLNFTLYHNNTLLFNGTWKYLVLSISLDNFSLGLHIFNMSVDDGYGNHATLNYTLTVLAEENTNTDTDTNTNTNTDTDTDTDTNTNTDTNTDTDTNSISENNTISENNNSSPNSGVIIVIIIIAVGGSTTAVVLYVKKRK